MNGIELIATERKRQVEIEGWTPEHDSEHENGELALAAVCYASPVLLFSKMDMVEGVSFNDPWPSWWDDGWDKRLRDDETEAIIPNSELTSPNRIRNLVKAGALIASEIDRLLAIEGLEK